MTQACSEVQQLDAETQSGSLNWKHLDRDRWRGEREDEGNEGMRWKGCVRGTFIPEDYNALTVKELK